MIENKSREHRIHQTRPDAPNGWGWFLFGLLTALFVGGAIRGLLSPQKIKLLVDEAVQAGKPPFTFRFDSAELSLRDGVLPRLGILAKGLRVAAIDRCVTRSELEIRELFIPISLTEALMGRLYVRRIRAVDARLYLQHSQCDQPTTTSQQARVTEPLVFFEKFFRTRFAQELINTREQLEGIEMENFQVFWFGESEPLVTFSYLRADMGHDLQPAHAVARLEFAKGFIGTSVAPYVWLDLVAELNRLQLSVRTLFREGMIEGQAMLSLPDTTVQWHADIKHFPMKPFYDRFLASRFPHLDLNMEGAWGFCRLQSSALLVRMFSDWTQVSQCFVEGSLGQMKLAPTRIALNIPWRVESTSIEIRDLFLERILPANEHLSFGVFEIEPEGFFSGNLTIDSRETRISGRVQDFELGFWRGLVRGRQPVTTASVEWSQSQTEDVLKISDIQSQGADWNGMMSLKRNHELQTHRFQIALSNVKLDRSLVHLYAPVELAPFEVKFGGALDQEQVVNLTGEFLFPSVIGPHFRMDNFIGSVSSDAQQHFLGRGDARNLQVFDRAVVDSLNPLVDDLEESDSEDLLFDRIRGDWEYRGKTLAWKNLRLLSKGSGAKWMTDGEFDPDQVLSARVLRLDARGVWANWWLEGPFPSKVEIRKDSVIRAPDRQTRQLLQNFDNFEQK